MLLLILKFIDSIFFFFYRISNKKIVCREEMVDYFLIEWGFKDQTAQIFIIF